jgi:hypothetical protein
VGGGGVQASPSSWGARGKGTRTAATGAAPCSPHAAPSSKGVPTPKNCVRQMVSMPPARHGRGDGNGVERWQSEEPDEAKHDVG